MLRSHLWTELTRTEIAEAARMDALVVIPIGATEQHGTHLPVGTDSFAAGTLALRAARAAAHPVLVAPTIQSAFSPHHLSWPGTISLKLATLSALIGDITASIAASGFRRQLLVNGHGGNRGPLMAITTELITSGREVGFVDYFAPPAEEIAALLKGSAKGVTHAGEVETALIMALLEDEGAALVAERAAGLPQVKGASYLARGTVDPIKPNGAWWTTIYQGDHAGYNGDPAAARQETGHRIAEAVTRKLSRFYTDFMRADLRSGVKPPADGLR